MIRGLLILVGSILLVALPVSAQDISTPEPRVVTVETADRGTLVGDFYSAFGVDNVARPAVLLMHMYSSNRQAWEALLPALTGYNVLNVDLRAHGESHAKYDLHAAADDVQIWLDWLRTQPGVRPEAISIVGASIGANFALIGCARDEQCVTAVALSPGLDYFGVKPEEIALKAFKKRSILMVTSKGDYDSIDGTNHMATHFEGEIGLRLFEGYAHGTDMFTGSLRDRVVKLIIDWLDEHTPPVEQ